MRILLGRVKGDKGDTGSQGPRGPQGERGPQGPPGEPGQTDIYTRAESDARYELKGNSIDFNELARRIPSWQWKVTMPKTVNQTVTAIVNGQIYTSDFYAPQGSVVTFSALGDAGYTAGIVSPRSATLTGDLTTVTITAATESRGVEAGSRTITRPSGTVSVKIPPNVCTVKMTADNRTKFVRVEPQGTLRFFLADAVGSNWGPALAYDSPPAPTIPGTSPPPPIQNTPSAALFYEIFGTYLISGSIVIEWSDDINKRYIDYDLTK